MFGVGGEVFSMQKGRKGAWVFSETQYEAKTDKSDNMIHAQILLVHCRQEWRQDC